MLNRERNRIMAEVILAVEENNNSKDSRKKATKKKRHDKPLLAGWHFFESAVYLGPPFFKKVLLFVFLGSRVSCPLVLSLLYKK